MATWQPFYRRATPSHTLEAKIAAGGESYGNPDMNYKAQNGQWICRNPINGHCWIMTDDGMYQFYDTTDKEHEDWNSLVARMKERERLIKIKKKAASKARKNDALQDKRKHNLLFHEEAS